MIDFFLNQLCVCIIIRWQFEYFVYCNLVYK